MKYLKRLILNLTRNKVEFINPDDRLLTKGYLVQYIHMKVEQPEITDEKLHKFNYQFEKEGLKSYTKKEYYEKFGGPKDVLHAIVEYRKNSFTNHAVVLAADIQLI